MGSGSQELQKKKKVLLVGDIFLPRSIFYFISLISQTENMKKLQQDTSKLNIMFV